MMVAPVQAEAPLLAVRNLAVLHGRFRALHGLDLDVGRGEIVSVIGANGAGKSSLLRALVNQVDRVEGSITFDGRSLAGRSTREIVAGGIALVPEGRRLFTELTVEENLALGRAVGRAGPIDLDAVLGFFPALGPKRGQRARELSGGQQQMVAIGRALMANPTLLLCDEISLGLAPVVIGELYALLPTIRDRGISLVVVEQDIGRSLAIADRFYCLLEGRVSLKGRPAEVDRDTVIRHYFGS